MEPMWCGSSQHLASGGYLTGRAVSHGAGALAWPPSLLLSAFRRLQQFLVHHPLSPQGGHLYPRARPKVDEAHSWLSGQGSRPCLFQG